ncbi:adenosine deaminase 2-like [Glandiceps talaboti]
MREDFLSMEASYYTGRDMPLEGKEWAVNDVLMQLKHEEIAEGERTSVFPPGMHFFHAKPYIDQSGVFEIIKLMPKGAVLHVHDNAIASLDWLVKNATYRHNCYMCIPGYRKAILFRFFADQPTDNSTCVWKLVETERNEYGDVEAFDKMLYDSMSMVVEDPHTMYTNQHEVWQYFEDYFAAVDGIVFYSETFKDYFVEGLKEFYNDGVQFVEIRALLQPIYDLDGTTYDLEHTVQEYMAANEAFLHDYEDSSGSKIIFTTYRAQDSVEEYIYKAMEFHKNYPNYVVGFDIVGQEDKGNPNIHFLEDLLIPHKENADLPYYLHAGETNWQGTETDENLIDALLLNTTRIGHGFAAIKHPLVLEQMKERDIPLEVNPISNQVLMLVEDLRNHPASHLLSQGYPVVVSSDDPFVWGASPISHDYYEMFMGVASANADLRILKQLTTDSIRYSSLSEDEQMTCMSIWSSKWDIFLDTVLDMYNITDWESYVPTAVPTTSPVYPPTGDTASESSSVFSAQMPLLIMVVSVLWDII